MTVDEAIRELETCRNLVGGDAPLLLTDDGSNTYGVELVAEPELGDVVYLRRERRDDDGDDDDEGPGEPCGGPPDILGAVLDGLDCRRGLLALGFQEEPLGGWFADGCLVNIYLSCGKYEIDITLSGGATLNFDVEHLKARPA
jgi:hypothetical protein